MLTREELQHLCLHQIIFTNVVITIQSYWKHQTRFLWMNERRGLFCSLQWTYTFLSKTVKAQLDYKPYINDSFCVEEVRELCLVITKDHFFFACILAWHLWDVESILQVNFSFGIIFLCWLVFDGKSFQNSHSSRIWTQRCSISVLELSSNSC